eukprot:503473-Rhodomonas_salina.3
MAVRNEEALRNELERVEDMERNSGVSMFQQKMDITRRLKRIETDRKVRRPDSLKHNVKSSNCVRHSFDGFSYCVASGRHRVAGAFSNT